MLDTVSFIFAAVSFTTFTAEPAAEVVLSITSPIPSFIPVIVSVTPFFIFPAVDVTVLTALSIVLSVFLITFPIKLPTFVAALVK